MANLFDVVNVTDLDTKNNFGFIRLTGAIIFGIRPKGFFWGVILK